MDQQPAYKLNIQRSVIHYFLLLPALLLSGLTSNALADALSEKSESTPDEISFILPPNHQSQYSMEKYGSHVGNMTNRLNYEEGVINYTSKAEAKGLASFFIKADPRENSVLNWPEDKHFTLPLQQSFNYYQAKKHKKNQRISFQHMQSGETLIEGIYKFKPYTLQTDQIIWGRQLLPLLMSSDLRLNPDITKNSFYITDKGHLQKYTYTLEAREKLEFKNNTLPVLKFKLTREGSQRMSYVWLSSAHYYLPLKIEQYKNGDLNVRMLMTQLNMDKHKQDD